MTTREKIIENVKNWGLKPIIKDNTVGWVNGKYFTIVWFDVNGEIFDYESYENKIA